MNRIALVGALSVALLGASLASAEPAADSVRRVVRAGTTRVAADGSVSHRSAIAATGAGGSVKSQGSATRDATGAVAQSRTTTATSGSTGNGATTTASYNKDTGRTRTTSCFDASGATIACPTRP